jgi:nicotinamide-nucleotide amidase
VTYSSAAKKGALSLSEDLLSKHGAVSESAVVSMAKNALGKAGTEFSVAVSGVAGPDGGTEDKPVGTVWFAWIGPQTIRAECCHFDGDRESVRRKSVARALEGLLTIVEQDA